MTSPTHQLTQENGDEMFLDVALLYDTADEASPLLAADYSAAVYSVKSHRQPSFSKKPRGANTTGEGIDASRHEVTKEQDQLNTPARVEQTPALYASMDVETTILAITDTHLSKYVMLVASDGGCSVLKTSTALLNLICDTIVPQRSIAGTMSSSQAPSYLPFWVDVLNPNNDDLADLQQFFQLHPLTVEDCLAGDTGEKWEFFDNYVLVVLYGQAVEDGGTDDLVPLKIVIYEDYVLTVHARPIVGLDLVLRRVKAVFEQQAKRSVYRQDRIMSVQPGDGSRDIGGPQHLDSMPHSSSHLKTNRRTLDSRSPLSFWGADPAKCRQVDQQEQYTTVRPLAIPSPGWVFYALIDTIVDIYMPYVDNLVKEVDVLDDLDLTLEGTEAPDLLRRIGLAKRSATTLRRFTASKHKILSYLVFKHVNLLSSDVQLYLRDVLDHLSTSLANLEYVRENLVQMHQNHLTRVNMDIAAATRRTDEFMHRVQIIVAVFAPLSVITGIFGMNVKVPGQDEDNLYWFFGINAFMLVISVLLITFFRVALSRKIMRNA